MTTPRVEGLEVVDLEPLAVDPQLQGQGVGSRLLAEHCRRLDATREIGYLETDRAENVTFHRRQGFEVVDQAGVIGVACWFMRRPPGRPPRRDRRRAAHYL